MKAVISTTQDDNYLFFLPITAWCWNKLGVDVVNFIPGPASKWSSGKEALVIDTLWKKNISCEQHFFYCPENKEATYAQCSRLYASALDLPEDEILITSDVDMITLKLPPLHINKFSIWGSDLVPINQYPICYISASVSNWREYFQVASRYTGMKNLPKWYNKKTLQECLDSLLGDIECENFRGNYWGKDQEEAFLKISHFNHQRICLIERARLGTQFASNRVDRDDTNWRSYLGPDLIDAHLWRPGYTDENFANIMELLTHQYPDENFQWLIDYRNEYIKLS